MVFILTSGKVTKQGSKPAKQTRSL